MYHRFQTLRLANSFLEENPSGRVVSYWNGLYMVFVPNPMPARGGQ